MARKDPQEHREKSAESMRRLRGHRATQKLAPATKAAPRAAAAPKTGAKRGPKPKLVLESDQEWAATLIVLGRSWIERSRDMLVTAPSAAHNLAMKGIELVNANRPMIPRGNVTEGPSPGSVALLDQEFLDDPEYLRLAEALLARKCDLQLEREKKKT